MADFRSQLHVFIERAKQQAKQTFQESADLALELAKEYTPVDLGTMRDSWELEQEPEAYRLYNPMPYANRIDNGWSRQAPEGVSTPVLRAIKQQLEQQ